MGKRTLLGACLIGTMALLATSSALAGSSGAGTFTMTEHFPNLVLVPPMVVPNPCNTSTLELGTFSAVATNAVGHFTGNANGFWDTFTAEGTVSFVPLDPTQPSFIGHVTTWDGESGNLNNFEATSILVVRLGPLLMKDVSHVTFFPATSTFSVEFDKPSLSCVG